MTSVWCKKLLSEGSDPQVMEFYGDNELLNVLDADTVSGRFDKTSIRFRLVTGYRFEDPLDDADIPEWDGPQLFFRKSTCAAVIPELPRWGRVWDVDCDGGEYVMFSAPCELDIFDYEKSEVDYLGCGAIYRFTKTAFFSDRIPDTAFASPLSAGCSLYIPGEMMDLLVSEKLTGLTFEKVWEY